jgi:hypothetical protein
MIAKGKAEPPWRWWRNLICAICPLSSESRAPEMLRGPAGAAPVARSVAAAAIADM